MSEQLDLTTLSGPGEKLRYARIERGFSIEEVANEMFLSVSQVEAIESNRYEALPGSTYIIGYWRSYSNLLGLDISDEIENHKNNLKTINPSIVLEPNHQKVHGHQEQSRKRSGLLFLILSAVFLGSIWYWQNPDDNPINQWVKNQSKRQLNILNEGDTGQDVFVDQNISLPAVENEYVNEQNSIITLPEPNFPEEQALEFAVKSDSQLTIQNLGDQELADSIIQQQAVNQLIVGDISELNSVEGLAVNNTGNNVENDSSDVELNETPSNISDSNDSEILQTEPNQDDASIVSIIQETQQTDLQQVADEPENWIIFDVDKQTWLDVSDSNSERLVYRTVENGETLKLHGQPPFYVFVGASEGVRISYLGAPVEFEPHKSGLFARFEVGQP